MPKATLAILDKFHPRIKMAIEAAVPADWDTVFIDEGAVTARASPC
jgi:hypothetical protein